MFAKVQMVYIKGWIDCFFSYASGVATILARSPGKLKLFLFFTCHLSPSSLRQCWLMRKLHARMKKSTLQNDVKCLGNRTKFFIGGRGCMHSAMLQSLRVL